MERLVISQAELVLADFQAGADEFQGLIYSMLWLGSAAMAGCNQASF